MSPMVIACVVVLLVIAVMVIAFIGGRSKRGPKS